MDSVPRSAPARPAHLANQARRVLEQEALSLAEAGRRLDPELFAAAVDLLLRCEGKVVTLGTGKSGLAARKIASTLSSTGTPAVFLHAADAMHGDVGLVDLSDCLIALSNSGETEEIVAVVGHLQRRGNSVIAIVGNLDSTLAQQATVALDAAVDTEACPLNLAPTTSTVLAIGVGDALAIALMTEHGFTADDFAVNHPGGSLGKRLTLTVADLMLAESSAPFVTEEAPFEVVLEAITRGGVGAVCVVAPDRTLTGIVTDGDVRRAIQRHGLGGLATASAGDVMTTNPVATRADVLAYAALQTMEDRPSQISVLPVIDDDQQCVGLLRLHDVVRAGLR
jgi:arabinose-5-phosphate isomerase